MRQAQLAQEQGSRGPPPRSPAAPTPPADIPGSPLVNVPNPNHTPPAAREDCLGDKIFNCILAGMGDMDVEDGELLRINKDERGGRATAPPASGDQGSPKKGAKLPRKTLSQTGSAELKSTVTAGKGGKKRAPKSKGGQGGVHLQSKNEAFPVKPWKNEGKGGSLHGYEMDEAWEEAMRDPELDMMQALQSGGADFEDEEDEDGDELDDEVAQLVARQSQAEETKQHSEHPPRPQSDDSEESVAQLGPHDEEDEDDEDELDGLRTHVASRAQNVDALENAAKRRKDEAIELMRQLEQYYVKHANEQVAQARAEVLHAWMQAQLLHLQNAPETTVDAKSVRDAKLGRWEAIRASVVVDIAHTRAAANTELTKRKECEARLRERYGELVETRQHVSELVTRRWEKIDAGVMSQSKAHMASGEEEEEEKAMHRGKWTDEIAGLDAEVTKGASIHVRQAKLLKSAKNHFVHVMLTQQERMLRERKTLLMQRKQELEEASAVTASEKRELETRAKALEEKTNMLVADNTVLARSLQAVQVWGKALKDEADLAI